MYTDLSTIEDCRRAINVPETVPAFADVPEKLREHMAAFYDMLVMNLAVNEQQKPDMDNHEVRKYEPLMYQESPGSGFVLLFVGHAATSSYVSARLAYVDFDRAKFAATRFAPVIDRFFRY